MYTEEVMDHFTNPRNMGELEGADGVGKVGNPACGDVMQLFLKIKEDNGHDVIKDIKFKTFGCAAAIATSSKITEVAEGLSLEEALEVENEEIADELGGLPKLKMHCSVLASDALKEAIYNYYKEQGRDIPQELKEKHKQNMEELEVTEEKREEYIDEQES